MSACLFNFGYIYFWSPGSLLIFTPGDYVTLSVPILGFLGIAILGATYLALPAAVLAIVAMLFDWKENIFLLILILIYIMACAGIIYYLRKISKKEKMRKRNLIWLQK